MLLDSYHYWRIVAIIEKMSFSVTGAQTPWPLLNLDDDAEIDVETGASVYSMDTELLTAWSCVETAVSGSRVEKDLLAACTYSFWQLKKSKLM